MSHKISRYALTYVFCMSLIGILLFGCGGAGEGSITHRKPTSMGKIYQINTLISPEVYDSEVIDSFDYRFGRAYPILPQPEPYFDLRYYEAEDLDAQPVLRQLKCFLVLADMSIDDKLTRMVRDDFRESVDFSESGVKIGQNKWAQEQIIVYIYAPDQSSLIDEIDKSYLAVGEKIKESYERMVKSTVYIQGQNRIAQDSIKQKFGVEMKIPADYVSALASDSLTWLRQEIPEISRSILISRFPYRNAEQFSEKGMIKMRDRLGDYVSSSIDGTYMRVNNIDLPTFITKTEIDGNYAMKAEGIWEIVGDFLGGAFASYAILDEENQEIVFIDGFVYSPEKQKKMSMIYLDHILRQTKLDPSFKKSVSKN